MPLGVSTRPCGSLRVKCTPRHSLLCHPYAIYKTHSQTQCHLCTQPHTTAGHTCRYTAAPLCGQSPSPAPCGHSHLSAPNKVEAEATTCPCLLGPQYQVLLSQPMPSPAPPHAKPCPEPLHTPVHTLVTGTHRGCTHLQRTQRSILLSARLRSVAPGQCHTLPRALLPLTHTHSRPQKVPSTHTLLTKAGDPEGGVRGRAGAGLDVPSLL